MKISSVTPGCYRAPLVAGLRQMHQSAVADQVERGELKLGITAQMRSVDRLRPELVSTFADALGQPDAQALAEDSVLAYYSLRLREGGCCVAHDGGVTRSGHGQSHYGVGELFLKS